MSYFTLELYNPVQITQGLGMLAMAEIFGLLSKTEKFKTLESISSYNIVLLDKGTFSSDVPFQGKIKKKSFALISSQADFTLSYQDETYYARINHGKLKVAPTQFELYNQCVQPDLSRLTLSEKQAWNWLEGDKTGLSSLTLCKKLYPQLEHYKLNEVDKNYFPYDNADFIRCLNFVEMVPEAKTRLNEMAELSPEWAKLVEYWDKIEEKIAKGKAESAYETLQKTYKIK